MKWLIFNYFALKKRWQLHYVPTISKVVKSTESGAKLPRFKSQLHYLLAAWLWTGYITLISSSVKWVYRNVYFIGLIWRVNEFTYIKHLEQCLAQGNASVSYCVINQSQLWHLFSMRRFFHVLSLSPCKMGRFNQDQFLSYIFLPLWKHRTKAFYHHTKLTKQYHLPKGYLRSFFSFF